MKVTCGTHQIFGELFGKISEVVYLITEPAIDLLYIVPELLKLVGVVVVILVYVPPLGVKVNILGAPSISPNSRQIFIT